MSKAGRWFSRAAKRKGVKYSFSLGSML
jgi:hypothetical protein